MAARAAPNWPPRNMRAALAAHHSGYPSESAFLAAVATGEMPAPFLLGGGDVWDRNDLDDAIDAIKAGTRRKPKWQEGAPARV